MALVPVALGLSMTLWLGACSSTPPDTSSCGPPHATFRLFVDTEKGPVPEDVRIHVRYGSGEEEFDARMENASLKVVFCNLERGVSPVADAGAVGPIQRVECDLWTDGAATVRVFAKGYLEVIRDLEAERDPICGLMLSEEFISLEKEE